ncbi:MAG TPA: hypothetical protein DDY37_04980, partial [Legionella sp.]|nr:hypothetical protein [Legionella sp.]
MKPFIKTSLVALLLANGSSYALNPVQGWYGGVLIGVNYTPSSNFSRERTFPFISTTEPYTKQAPLRASFASNHLEYSTMGAVGGQLGYRCGKYRLEGQFLYNNSPYRSLRGTVTGPEGQQTSFSIYAPSTSTGFRIEGSTDSGLGMLNGFYDFLPSDPRSNVAPYIGLGVGYAYFSNNLRVYYNEVNIDAARVKESISSPAGQAILGVSYFLDDFASFALDVRYFTSTAKSTFMDSR